MPSWSLAHLPDHELFPALAAGVAQERGALARVLALIAEFDARELYLPRAQPTMYAYCVHVLHLSEDRACKRIRAARLARRFPRIFDLVADGRLCLGGLMLIAPRLEQTGDESLLDAAVHRTRAEIEELLAARFPRPAVATTVTPVSPAGASEVGSEGLFAVQPPQVIGSSSAPGRMNGDADGTATPAATAARPRVAPLAPGRYELRGTMSQAMRDRLERARALLSHAVPSGDAMEVLDRALVALIEKLEKRRHSTTERPRGSRRSERARHVPADVRRAVRERDGDRCTFTSATGERCAETRFLEYDHIQPVACGGQAETDNVRLLCRAHNQYEAKRRFGSQHVVTKRELAQRARARTRAAKHAAMDRDAARKVRAGASGSAASAPVRDEAKQARHDDLFGALTGLGFHSKEALAGAAVADDMAGASLEACLRAALQLLTRRVRTRGERLARCSA